MSVSEGDLDRKRFNHWTESYETSFLRRLVFHRVHRAVITQIPAEFIPSAILDIGCGTGRLLRKLHKVWPNAKLVGIDLAERQANAMGSTDSTLMEQDVYLCYTRFTRGKK